MPSSMPTKIVILRHGEKTNPFELCCLGVHRSVAIAEQYLGRNAASSLFADGEQPAAFFAITLHTLETASPSAQSWGLPITVFGAVPILGSNLGECDQVLDERTKQAVASLSDWAGKIVVMVWEHKRIADPKQKVSLYNLLGLSGFVGPIPQKWPGENYDYFWEVNFDTSGALASFKCSKQQFNAPYHGLPHNDWGVSARLPVDCET